MGKKRGRGLRLDELRERKEVLINSDKREEKEKIQTNGIGFSQDCSEIQFPHLPTDSSGLPIPR